MSVAKAEKALKKAERAAKVAELTETIKALEAKRDKAQRGSVEYAKIAVAIERAKADLKAEKGTSKRKKRDDGVMSKVGKYLGLA